MTSPATPAAEPTRTSPPAPATAPTRQAAPPATRPTGGGTRTDAGPPVVTSYEAESAANGLADTRIYTCYGCSGSKKVGNIGRGMGVLQFNGVTARTAGSAVVTLAYVNGESARAARLSVNGGAPIWLSFAGTGGWSTVGTMVVTVTVRSGVNTLTLFNPYAPAPDFDKITVTVPAR